MWVAAVEPEKSPMRGWMSFIQSSAMVTAACYRQVVDGLNTWSSVWRQSRTHLSLLRAKPERAHTNKSHFNSQIDLQTYTQ